MKRVFLLLIVLFSSAAMAEGQHALSQKIVEGAVRQIGITTGYDPAYRNIAFPGGDVPIANGVCSDVVIRAYRHAGIDLQLLVNQDMRKHFSAYPHLWGLTHPDANIDHRRVPNLAVFFTRHGQSLPVSADAHDYLPGDIVTWRLPSSGLVHVGLVSDTLEGGRPLMIHNIGHGAQRQDVLFAFTITGHYRYLPHGKPV